MVPYADLILPDTTYLERWDCISLLDRPISEADGPADAIRQPVVQPDRDVRPFQSVLLDLGARLGLPGFVDEDGAPKYPGGYADYIVNHERQPGIGPLAGWRGENGDKFGRGEPNPNQLERYVENGCFHVHHLPDSQKYFKHANKDYLEWAGRRRLHRQEPSRSCFSSTASRCSASGSPRRATARPCRRSATARASSGISIPCPSGIRRSRVR